MNNNFKNPFELDEEDTIISLEPTPTINNQIGFSTTTQNNFLGQAPSAPANPPTVKEGSMFDLLDPKINQEEAREGGEQEEPPLLQDIGIDIDLIKNRIMNILTLGDVNSDLVQSPDLSGPIIIAFLLGFLLLLGGKIHFSDILTGFILGNGAMYILFNFMARETQVSFYCVMSYLGYSLLPMLILAVFGILFSLNNAFGVFSSLILAGWSSYTAGNTIGVVLNRQQGRILLSYPLFLFYLSFALIIIF